jgi:transcription termination factor Rho
MSLPPKSDDASSADEKKTRRPRATKAAASKADKPAAKGRARRGPTKAAAAVAAPEAKAPAPAQPLPAATPAPAPSAPAPREEAPRPVFVRSSETPPPAPAPAPAPAAAQPQADLTDVPRAWSSDQDPGAAAESGRSSDQADRSAEAGERPSQQGQPPQAGHGQGGGGQGQGGGGRGEWQGHQGGQHGFQGGGQDRGFWKHGKRKRGRHGGGPWQPGGGGGGGGQPGGREQHPPQLPPPSNAPVFGDLPNPSRFTDLAALDALAAEISASGSQPLWLNEIYARNLSDLTAFCRGLGLKVEGAPPKRQLIGDLFRFISEQRLPLRDRGHIDQNDRGCFIVHDHVNYRLYPEDAFLPDTLVKRYGLKRGHRVEVTLQPPLEGERCPSVIRVDRVMDLPPDDIAKITPFEELVPYYPLKRILLEDPEVVKDVSMRAVDILTPIGFGQRGLIVAPPRTGKTVLLQNIANSITANSPDVKLILLLIDERPEEVTDFKRHTKGEVVSSTFDETPESHVHCAEMVIEIARRRIEQGEHVVILLDSITRLARAYNALTGSGGKTMSGGLESNALQKPKRFFGSARNIEGGGSLTIIASALIDTGSRMDEIIFEEFKGTGNSELHLDRGLVERRIFPAINIDRSGTRKEELIYHPDELQRIYGLRRAMQGLGPIESMEMLITRLKKTKSNAEFLMSLAPK